jgi:uncharacterized membrane protein YkvI
MTTEKKVSWVAIIGVASTWFGIHAGGGFASGAQTMGFTTRYGIWALFTPILVVALMAWMFREMTLIAKNHHAYDFHSMTKELYKPYDKIMCPIYEFVMLVASLMAISSCVAGGASVMKSYLGVPYGIGIVIIGFIMLILAIYGAKLVIRANTVLAVILVVSVTTICFVAIGNGKWDLSGFLATPAATATPFYIAIIQAISYAGFQTASFPGLLGVTGTLKTTDSINKTYAIGFIINGVMLWFTSFVMLGYMPESSKATLPLYYVTETSGQQWLLILYIVALLAAYISTGVGVVFGTTKRYTIQVVKKYPNIKASSSNFVLGAIFITITVLISTIGLTRIINYGFKYCGYVGMFIMFLPAITVGHIKNRRFAKEHPNYDKENLLTADGE